MFPDIFYNVDKLQGQVPMHRKPCKSAKSKKMSSKSTIDMDFDDGAYEGVAFVTNSKPQLPRPLQRVSSIVRNMLRSKSKKKY
jgi:hypothetical protein